MANFNDGIIQPTLIEQLKSILDQYPDDGQILKELVQNADDAGARTVKFLWDENEYPAHNIYRRQQTSHFQGPALLAYNDAGFSVKDLEGIRMIQKSVKREDALKVGRFGLGFKSVFHMTDLVGLVTSHGVAFIDPHEELYHRDRDTGRSTSSYLWDPTRELDDMKQFSDMWMPFYHDIFRYDRSVLEGGRQSSYDGTIFRFPFRKSASPLSSKVYSSTEAERLIDSLKEEGHLYLLFLKSIESIEFHHKAKGAPKPSLVYRTCIVERDRAIVRRERGAFFRALEPGASTSTVYKCDIATELHSGTSNKQEKRFSYLIGLQMDYSGQLGTYSNRLSYMPTMGAALSLNGPDLEVSSGGQLFCFLPMPLETDSPTGLNVHVHGYFALDQNRRHLKLPSAEQKGNVSDPQLIWNSLLTQTLLPRCLISLVLKAVQDPVIRHHVYSLFPIYSLLQNDFWRAMVPAFYTQLQPQHVFRGSNGQFVKAKDAVFQDEVQDRELPLLGKVVADAGYTYVVVPSNTLSELQTRIGVYALNADLVSKSVKAVEHTLTEAEKLQLLSYFLQQRNAALLNGLMLFPLENGAWASLSLSYLAPNRLYLDESGEGKKILGTTAVNFINVAMIKARCPETIALASELSRSATTSLKVFDKADMAAELRKQIGGDARIIRQIQHRPEWFRDLWTYIETHFYNNLSDLEGLHIVNIERNTLEMCLSSNNVIVCTANPMEKWLFEAIGVTVVGDLPDSFRRHAQRNHYVLNSNEVAKVFMKQHALLARSRQALRSFFDRMTSDGRRKWRTFLAGQGTNEISVIKQILMTLPIFETIANSGGCVSCFVSVGEVGIAMRGFFLPGRLPNKVISLDDSSANLARLLGVEELSFAKALDEEILPNLREPTYNRSEIEAVAQYCIDNNYALIKECPGIMDKLRYIKFVSDKTGNLRRPGDFLDPTITELCQMFEGLDVFPAGTFTGKYIAFLRDNCGLRSDINSQELTMVALYIHSNNKNKDITNRAKLLLKYFERNPQQMRSVNIGNLAWVPVLHSRPTGYPMELPWAGSSCFTATEASVVFESMASSCGSVRPCCKWSGVLQRNKPSLQEIVRHFTTIISLVTIKTQGLDVILKSIYERLKDFDKSSILKEFEVQQLQKWVWNGNEFVDSARIIVKFPDELKLSPYAFKLPREFALLTDFFVDMGCLRECTNNTLIRILQKIKGTKLDDDSLRTVRQVAAFLAKDKQWKEKICTDQEVFLPTKDRIMMNVKDLCINVCPWIPITDMNLCDPEIAAVHAHYLGVKTNKKKLIDNNRTSIGKPFGQHEKLITRIKRILEGYPRNSSIMKEMLQNADDSGASELHFVIDKRTHSGDKIFNENWRNLQGPALLVYNDSSFTQADIDGIQALGEGSKSDDPVKTGKYGVGFNAVYHVTDTPTFVTNCDGLKLCAFDPQMKSVPGSSQSHPGQMFEITGVSDAFPDVVKCYSDQGFDLTHGTLFRLPLRTKELAMDSEISREKCNEQDIENILTKFMHEAEETLLFVRNVRKIRISKIDTNGKSTLLFECTAERTSGQNEHRVFWDYVKSTMRAIKNIDMKLENIRPEMASSTLKISKTLSQQSHSQVKKEDSQSSWIVIQQFGFRNVEGVDKGVRERFNNGDIRLSIMGGVAYRLDRAHPQTEHRLFCFLPLPVKIPFAFHINGDFVLNYETRDDLVAEDKKPELAMSNDAVLAEIVAPTVVELIKAQKAKLSMADRETFALQMQMFLDIYPLESDADKKTGSVHSFFQQLQSQAIQKPTKEKFSALVKAVFLQIYSEQLPLLPMTTEESSGELVWLPPSKDAQGNAVFFDNMRPSSTVNDKELANIRTSMKGFGMRLLWPGNSMRSIYTLFKKFAPNSIKEISPQAAFEFLQGVSVELPKPIERTPYRSVDALKSICLFILPVVRPQPSPENSEVSEEKPQKRLDNLPILLTGDKVLHFYQPGEVFLECFDLFPHSPEKFLHWSFRGMLRNENRNFAQVTLSVLADILLPKELPQISAKDEKVFFREEDEQSKLRGGKIVLRLENKAPLQKEWLCKLWKLMDGLVENKMSAHKMNCGNCKNGKTCNPPNTETYIKPLAEWCIYPCLEEGRQLLIKIGASKRVLRDSLNSAEEDVDKALSKFRVMKPSPSSELSTLNLYRSLHGSVNDPVSVIVALRELLVENERECLSVAKEHCEPLLGYFARHLKTISKMEDAGPVLQRLPIYPSVEGPISSNSRSIFVLPQEITGLKVVFKNSFKMAFVFWKGDLIELYRFLQFRELSIEDVYKEHILPTFDTLVWKEQAKHLDFWQQRVNVVLNNQFYARVGSSESRQIQAEMDRYSDLLAEHKLFFNETEEAYQEARDFYCWWQVLFLCFRKANVPANKYQRFQTLLDFLGMRTEVTDTHILTFAREIERDSSKAANEKRSTLIKYLLNATSVPEGVKSIAFLTTIQSKLETVLRPSHQECHFSCFSGSAAQDVQALVWSQCDILAESQAPPSYTREMFRMIVKPTITQIASHIQAVCGLISEMRSFDKHTANLYAEELKQIVNYCSKTDIAAFEQLNFIPASDNSANWILATPGNIILNSSAEDEHLFPYIVTFSQVHKEVADHYFLKRLGAIDRGNPDCYLKVLNAIAFSACGQIIDDPNDLNKIKVAYGSFIDLLQTGDFEENPDTAYFLGSDDCMHPANELTLLDVPQHRERLLESDANVVFLCGLDQSNADQKEAKAFGKLPERLRPKMLSSFLRELLDDDLEDAMESENAREIREKLRSLDFAAGLFRIVQRNHKQTLDDEDLEEKVSLIQNASVRTVDELRVRIMNGEIEMNVIEKPFFILKQDDTISVILDKAFNGSATFWFELTGELTKHFCLDQTHTILLAAILSMKPNESISDYLAEQFGKWTNFETIVLPSCGSEVPSFQHRLLYPGLDVKHAVGRFVALERGGGGVYVFGKVLKRIDGENGVMDTLYVVDVGEDAPRECRPDEIFAVKKDPTEHIQRDVAEIVINTRAILEEVYRGGNEKARESVFLRLVQCYDDSCFEKDEHKQKAGRIQDFLRRERDRLDAQYRVVADVPAIYEEARRIVTVQIRQLVAVREVTYSVAIARARNPSPAAARTYLRQAEHDLRAVRNDLDGAPRSYCWACYKCHASAEKALKAVLYNEDYTQNLEHHLPSIAAESGLRGLARELEGLTGNHVRMRYPNGSNNAPAELYDQRDAQNALELATRIVARAKELIG